MKQLLFATMWGLIEEAAGPYPLSKLPALVHKLKSLGYSGIEMPIAMAMKFGTAPFLALLRDAGMLYIAQVFSSGAPPTPGNLGIPSTSGISHPADSSASTRDVARHKAVWEGQVRECALLKEVLYAVNSHTGKDYFSDAEADDLLSYCLQVEAELGIVVNHETHRARILYSPWQVPRILAAHPGLCFTADLSHFSCVTETGADDPEVCAVVAALTPRTRHVHARVGFQEGPQVPDPRGPIWAPYMEGYKVWWKAIYAARLAAGDATLSTTPEFGPFMYAWVRAHAPGPVPGRADTLNNVWAIKCVELRHVSCVLFVIPPSQHYTSLPAATGWGCKPRPCLSRLRARARGVSCFPTRRKERGSCKGISS